MLRPAFSQYGARSLRLKILPESSRGSDALSSTTFGTLGDSYYTQPQTRPSFFETFVWRSLLQQPGYHGQPRAFYQQRGY